jgi:lipopolysaccharide transport system permease protein
MHSDITVYEPRQRSRAGMSAVLRVMAADVLRCRGLIWQLFKRDFLMQYKKSFLGLGWIVLAPLIGFASWVFMNAAGVLNPGTMDFPYPAFVLVSTVLWGFFTSSVIAASRTLKAGQGFIDQVQYPHHTLLVKELAQAYANFLISFVFTAVLLACFRVDLPALFWAAPLLVLPMLAAAAAIGLTASILSAVSMDIEKGIGYVLGFWMFLTPVVYTAGDKGGMVKMILAVNPMTYLYGAARDLIVFGQARDWPLFAGMSAAALLVLLLAMRWFYVAEERVIEKML